MHIIANFRDRNIGKDLAIRLGMLYNIQAGLPPIAQLDRVPDSDSVGRGFESPWAGQKALIKTISAFVLEKGYSFLYPFSFTYCNSSTQEIRWTWGRRK